MEPRRIALAVVLMAAVLILTPYLFPPSLPPSVPAAGGAVITDSLRGSAEAAAAGSIDRPVPGGAAAAAGAADSSFLASGADASLSELLVDTVLVSTPLADYRTTNRGAMFIGATMTRYQTLSDRGRIRGAPVELSDGDRLLAFRVVIPGDTIALDRRVFHVSESSDNGSSSVRYETELASGVGAERRVAITYSFLPDSYRVNVRADASGLPENSFLLVELPRGFNSAEADSAEDQRHLAYAYKPELRGAKAVAFRSLDPGERRIEPGPIAWVVAKNKYFMLGVLAPSGAAGFAEVDFTGGPRLGKVASRGEASLVLPLTGGSAAFEMYVGPQEFLRLLSVGREFETSNPYGGWIQGIVQPFAAMIIRLLLWMKSTLGLSYGWILVIFGVAVRVLLWPLNQKAMRSQLQMQRIQPELQAIQTRHKGNPQQLQAAMMQLYKDHGMSPFSSLSGCLPMLIPLPVFFALFFVFQNTIEFRGVPFLWFPDISVKDPYYIIPMFVAITALLLSWIGMRGIKAGQQQKMMMYMMPAMMLVFFFNLASGLNLYYFIQNLASLPQQWLISRERSKAVPLVGR